MIHVPKQSAATAGGLGVSCRRFSAVPPVVCTSTHTTGTGAGWHPGVVCMFLLIHGHGPFLCFGHKGCCTSSSCAASAESPPLQVFWGKKHQQHLGFGWVAPSRSPSAFPELARVFPTINSLRISFLTLILICAFGLGGN